jgi:hypothetical protein
MTLFGLSHGDLQPNKIQSPLCGQRRYYKITPRPFFRLFRSFNFVNIPLGIKVHGNFHGANVTPRTKLLSQGKLLLLKIGICPFSDFSEVLISQTFP